MKIKSNMTPNCQTLVDLNVILYICGSSDRTSVWILRRTDFIHALKITFFATSTVYNH